MTPKINEHDSHRCSQCPKLFKSDSGLAWHREHVHLGVKASQGRLGGSRTTPRASPLPDVPSTSLEDPLSAALGSQIFWRVKVIVERDWGCPALAPADFLDTYVFRSMQQRGFPVGESCVVEQTKIISERYWHWPRLSTLDFLETFLTLTLAQEGIRLLGEGYTRDLDMATWRRS